MASKKKSTLSTRKPAPKKRAKTKLQASIVVFTQVDAFKEVCDVLEPIGHRTHESDETLLRMYALSFEQFEFQITVLNVKRRAGDAIWPQLLDELPRTAPTALCFVGCWPLRSGLVFGPLNITTHTGKLEWALDHFAERLENFDAPADTPRFLLLGADDDDTELSPPIDEADQKAFRALVRQWHPIENVIAYGATSKEFSDARARLAAALLSLGVNAARS